MTWPSQVAEGTCGETKVSSLQWQVSEVLCVESLQADWWQQEQRSELCCTRHCSGMRSANTTLLCLPHSQPTVSSPPDIALLAEHTNTANNPLDPLLDKLAGQILAGYEGLQVVLRKAHGTGRDGCLFLSLSCQETGREMQDNLHGANPCTSLKNAVTPFCLCWVLDAQG